MQVRTIAFVFALVTAAVASPAGQLVQVAQEGSSLRYHIVHKLHTVDAVAKNVEGKALIQPDGSVQIMVRAPVSAFDSGDGNRDEHMKETVESLRFPYVTFKGLARLPAVNTYPARLSVPVDGELEFHGQKNAERLNIDVMMTSATAWHVTGKFEVSLDKYKVERPSLFLVKIDDACVIDVDLSLVAAGGK